MWGAVGAGNHFGGFVTCPRLAGPSQGEAHRDVDTGCAPLGRVLAVGLGSGGSGGPWSSSGMPQAQEADGADPHPG